MQGELYYGKRRKRPSLRSLFFEEEMMGIAGRSDGKTDELVERWGLLVLRWN